MDPCSSRKIGVLSNWLKTVVIFPEVVIRLRPGLPLRSLSWYFTDLPPQTVEFRRGSFWRRWWFFSLDACSLNRLSIVHVVEGYRFAFWTVFLFRLSAQRVCIMLVRSSWLFVSFCFVLLCFGLCLFWVLVPLINHQLTEKKNET